ncbi:DUF3888 domain-containing protein [Pullulanibacillus sp. KACC 23026]|uniref:DUF3888 domain-containing protein n=1 Tax=Pullulanibacillus sp. KACC 23026 TaxID=3028315 RepID=UPI0023AE9DC9|nr:DUF3888 domain-containing protein [Pullulanibacillus sp. KACC 23026]WEG11455.1 DUF3888 domain-containing protein [Pullulanibacillus sp. KACC 23026]
MEKFKKGCMILISGCLIGLGMPAAQTFAKPHAQNVVSIDEKNDQLQDTLLTLLTPALDEAVEKVYGKPQPYDLFNAKIETIERPQSGGFHFIVTVSIQTFEGAHNPPYGRDSFTFDVTPDRTILLHTKHTDVQAQL